MFGGLLHSGAAPGQEPQYLQISDSTACRRALQAALRGFNSESPTPELRGA